MFTYPKRNYRDSLLSLKMTGYRLYQSAFVTPREPLKQRLRSCENIESVMLNAVKHLGILRKNEILGSFALAQDDSRPEFIRTNSEADLEAQLDIPRTVNRSESLPKGIAAEEAVNRPK